MKFTKKKEFILPTTVLIIGMFWIFFADYLVVTNNFISWVLTTSNIYRDSFFILVVSVILFFILKRHRIKSEQSEKEYQNLFDSSPVPTWIFDRDTLGFLLVNKAAITHYGYSKTEFLRMSLKDIRPPVEHARLEENIRQIHTDLQNHGTWQHLRKNGEIIIAEVISTNVIFEDKIRRLAVAHDITAIRMAEETRRTAERKLQANTERIGKQNQQLRDIAFNTSHLVRAPLANILGLVAVFDENGHTLEEKEELLKLIKVSAGQLDTVIKDIVSQTMLVNEDPPGLS